MNLGKLKQLLSGIEWTDVEFKEASHDVPKSGYETVSAFANTHGGWLIFGIKQGDDGFEIAGVNNPDKIQNDFLSVLHADQKLNHDIAVTEKQMNVDGRTILAFHIEENPRTRKPVYLDGDIRRTFIRRGGGDYKAQMPDIERMLRDATADRWDAQVFEYPFEEAIDKESLVWYLGRFHDLNQGFDRGISNEEFLLNWGHMVHVGGERKLTRAAIMLFGSPRTVRQLMPRPTIDLQFIPSRKDAEQPEVRWLDRYVSEENIIVTWRQLVAKYMFFMPKPFQGIDPHSLMRQDTPPSFRVFREAAINLLIHQDYGDHSRKAVIKFYQDGILFWNPGDVFGGDKNLLDPGEKEVRNPKIVGAMRRIVLCEQAGTGIRMMNGLWKQNGHPEPTYLNDRSRKAFEFYLPGLDVDLGGTSSLMRALIGRDIAGQVTGTAQVTGEVTVEVAGEVADDVAKMLTHLQGSMTRSAIQKSLELKGQANFRERYLLPALSAGLIEMTIPEKPKSRLQKYRLTEKGKRVLEGFRIRKTKTN